MIIAAMLIGGLMNPARPAHANAVTHGTVTAAVARPGGDGDSDSDDLGTTGEQATAPAAASSPAGAVTSTPSSSTGGGLSNVPGVPASFAACVAFRESTNGLLSSNIYGIIPASGYNVIGASLAVQKQAFSALYAAQGTAPWAPYDGC